MAHTVYLGNHGQADEIGQEAHAPYEEFPVFAQGVRILVDERGEEALHGAELAVHAQHQHHQEKQDRPQRGDG